MIRHCVAGGAAVFVLSVGMPRQARAQHDDPGELIAHRVAANAAVDALPDSLRAFFHERRSEFVDMASLVTRANGEGEADRGDRAHHIVWLDAGAARQPDAERLQAAREFPEARAEADALLRRLSLRGGGSLPWSLKRAFEKLVEAFSEGDADRIIRLGARVTHLAVDAAQPFQTTRLARWDDWMRVRGAYADALARYEARLAYEVRVAPVRFRCLDDVLDATFETLRAAHASAVLDFEPWLTLAPHDATDADEEEATRGRIATEDELAACLEQRIEAGAVLAANLLGSAWIRANLPSLPSSGGAIAVQQEARAQAPAASESPAAHQGGLVGSRNSKIVHRSGCPHVARIKQSNRARFPSMEAARRAGRRPCRTCKPQDTADGK